MENRNTFGKTERLCSRKAIETLFAGNAKSFSAYPVRAVFLPIEEADTAATILISVSKKKFKHAVKRNRVKRQIREAYRKNKPGFVQTLSEKQQKIHIAFIYQGNELLPSHTIDNCVKTLLQRITDYMQPKQ